jgi:predicted AlkP superfamily pyrophosphatase or phosphodiesterase
MNSKTLFFLSVLLFTAGVLFFLQGFFLSRVELPTRSNDYLDIKAALTGIEQEETPYGRYLAKSVLDLGHSLPKNEHNDQLHVLKAPYFALFEATQTHQHGTDSISPLTLLTTLHSMPTTYHKLFSPTLLPSQSTTIPTQLDQQTCSWFCRQYDQIFYLVIDALRFDFLHFNQTLSPLNGLPPAITLQHPPYLNRLSSLSQYHSTHPTSSAFYKFRADTPTVTMQRLKAMVTGSLPTFLDVKDNFAATMIQEDNLFIQLDSKGHNTIMVGDDTWMGLVGGLLSRAYPFPSFDVHDLDTVDNGCIYRIHHELCGRTISAMQLGVQEYFGQLLTILEKNTESTSLPKSELTNILTAINNLKLQFEKDNQYSESDKAKISSMGSQFNPQTFTPNIDYFASNTLPTWFIAHFLGVDHVGHRFGPRHPLMDTKLGQMNQLLHKFLDYLKIYDGFYPKEDNFSKIFTAQYAFIQEYCEPETYEQFSPLYSQINHFFSKTTSLSLLPIPNKPQLNTQLPSPRTVVYVMGDHGMTEGGNHGGPSIKETMAGFAVLSTLTLDSPSSYLKHSLLHQNNTNGVSNELKFEEYGSPRDMIKVKFDKVEDIFAALDKFDKHDDKKVNTNQTPYNVIKSGHSRLPELALIYDFTHIRNYDDVYTQTHIQSPDNEHFSMGQIDSLPTLSLISGVPIPYGNLGVLKKELVPNQFLHQMRGRLHGTYGDEWGTKENICTLFSVFSEGENVSVKIAEMRHELMILNMRVLNIGQMLRYANDYKRTVKTFSGIFVQDALVHAKTALAKLNMVENALELLSKECLIELQRTSQKQSKSQLSSKFTADELSSLMDTLYPAIIDTNQHLHLIMTHVKTGFTREWTQFDMAFIYASLITLFFLTSILLAQFLKSVVAARKNESTSSTTLNQNDVDRIAQDMYINGGKYSQNHSFVPYKYIFSFLKLFIPLPGALIISPFPFLKSILKASCITMIAIGIGPCLIWLCRATWMELHIPIPIWLSTLNDYVRSGGAVQYEEDALELAQAITTTETVKNNIYTINVFTFLFLLFALTFFFLVTIHFCVQFIIYYESIRSIVMDKSVKVYNAFVIKSYGDKIAMEKRTWGKFVLTILVLLLLLQGFCSNSYIENESLVMHVVCTVLASWVLFTMYNSYCYYYYIIHADGNNGEETKRDNQLGIDASAQQDQRGRKSIPLPDEDTNSGSDDSDSETKSLLSKGRGVVRSRSNTHARDSDANVDHFELNSSNPPTKQTVVHADSKIPLSQPNMKTSPSKKNPIRVLKPYNVLILCLIAFFCIFGMRTEVELAHTNAKLVFSIPYSEHTSFVSWFQSVIYGHHSPLETLFKIGQNGTFLPNDEIVEKMGEIRLNTKTEINNAGADSLIKKPQLIDAVIHRKDGDNHNHDEISERLLQRDQHEHEHQKTEHEHEYEHQKAEKADPVQLLKTALNMFSPDIALDGLYIRKQPRTLVTLVDTTQSQQGAIIPYTGELYHVEDYQERFEEINKNLKRNFLKSNPQFQKTDSLQAIPTTSEFFDTALDTRSHYSALHLLIIFATFISGLIVVQRYMMTKYRGPTSLAGEQTVAKFEKITKSTKIMKISKPENIPQPTITNFAYQLPGIIRAYTSYIVPTTGFYVSCYWIPTYIATVFSPFISFILTISGTCRQVDPSKQIPSYLFSETIHLQLCSSQSVMKPLIVQFLRAYIPICVYLIGIIGIVLFTLFIFQFSKISNISNNPHQIPFALRQYYNHQNLLSFIFIILFPTVCLVSGARSTVTYSFFIILLEIFKRLIITLFVTIPYEKQLVHITNIVALFVFLIIFMFHTTGHAYSFNDIHIASGFVGVPGYIFGVSELLVFLNSFGGFIFGVFGTLQLGLFTTSAYNLYRNQIKEDSNGEDSKFIVLSPNDQLNDSEKTRNFLNFSLYIPISWMLFWIAIRLFVCTLNVHFQRRDLFVWALYSPYWLIVAITSILTYAMVILYTLTIE